MARNTVLLNFIQSVCHTTPITIIALTFQGQSEGCCSIINTKYRWCTMDVICQVMFQTQKLQGVPKKSLSESSVILSPQPSFSKSADLRKIVQKPGWGDMAFLKTTEHSDRDSFGTPVDSYNFIQPGSKGRRGGGIQKREKHSMDKLQNICTS